MELQLGKSPTNLRCDIDRDDFAVSLARHPLNDKDYLLAASNMFLI